MITVGLGAADTASGNIEASILYGIKELYIILAEKKFKFICFLWQVSGNLT
jgi:hypothetical protein